jgi:hypothetical protein
VDDDETPTPPSWFLPRTYREECRKFANRLDTVALVSAKRLDLLDFARARRAGEIAHELRRLARIFDGWDDLPPEQVARESTAHVPAMCELLREALAMLQAMPSHPTLGPVRGK